MLFLILLGLACCSVEKLLAHSNYSAWNYVLSDTNTVHFVQTSIKEYVENSIQPLSDQSLNTRIRVYKGDPNNEKAVFYLDEKASEANTFFFTTPGRDIYYIRLDVLVDPDEGPRDDLGLEVKVFSGESNRPSIVSTNDVEVSRAENLIERALSFIKHNISIQEMDEEDEVVYKGLYQKIMKKVVYVLFLKIVATIFLMYYSNRKTKNFYATLEK